MKIFDTLLGFLPSWVPFAAIGVLALGLVGGFFALNASWQAEGTAKVIAADQKAMLEQKAKDEKLLAELIANQAAEIAALQDRAQTVITRIDHAPTTTGCGPVMRDASHGVRELFQHPGGADAGRQPAAALPGSAAGRWSRRCDRQRGRRRADPRCRGLPRLQAAACRSGGVRKGRESMTDLLARSLTPSLLRADAKRSCEHEAL